MKKLIFLRNGILGDDWFHTKENLNLSSYYIDVSINTDGYKSIVDKLGLASVIMSEYSRWDYIVTTYPCLMSAHNHKNDPLWWNEDEHKWEIYFVEKGELKNIQEYTDKELRMAHNIEKLYLSGGLDNE